MFKKKKNDPAAKELESYAQKSGLPLRDVLLSDEHLKNVCDIFYPHLPKLVRMSMNKEKFSNFYQKNREIFVSQIL